jgi:hypothetical protein
MTPHRPGTELATFASLLVLIATTSLASLRIADDPASLDPRMLDLCFIALAALAVGLAVSGGRIRLLMPAAPVLVLVGLLHLGLALRWLTGSAAATAGIGGAVELIVGLSMLPSALSAVLGVPLMRKRIEALEHRRRVATLTLTEAATDLGQADAKADELRGLAVAWERFGRAQEARAARLQERLGELRGSLRPEDNILVIPASAPGALRGFLLGVAQSFGWTRVGALPEAVRLAVGQGQVVYVDGLQDPVAECLFLQAVGETEVLDGESAPWAPTRELPAAGRTTRVIDELVAVNVDAGAPLRTLRDTVDRAATTLPSGEEAVA